MSPWDTTNDEMRPRVVMKNGKQDNKGKSTAHYKTSIYQYSLIYEDWIITDPMITGLDTFNHRVESIKTMSMEPISTGVLDQNKEHYLRSKDKAKNAYEVSRHIWLHMSKCKNKMKIYNPLCQTCSPTVI